MRRIKQWVDCLSIKKKLVFYGYMICTPVLILICIILVINNYKKVSVQKLLNDQTGVRTLAESFNLLQTEIKDFSTYICINNDIVELLSTREIAEKNENARLWFDEAPMQIVQDMISLKGYIKTIAIYPENGIRPYLRCMDGSAYVSDLDTVRKSKHYEQTGLSENGMLWRSVAKGKNDTFQMNRSDKIVLYREIYDLSKKKKLGYISIGVSREYFEDLCKSIVKNPKESVCILENNEILCQTGQIAEDLQKYLSSEEFASQSQVNQMIHFVYDDFDVSCVQLGKNDYTVCKIVPRYRLQMQIIDIVYMPCMLLIGMLIGLLPLLVIISNLVTNPLYRLTMAINEVSNGDFEQQVEVTTHDEIGEVAACFNRMVLAIKELINRNYVMSLREKEIELAALQAQINPHFLYNTLDSLYWQALNAGNDEIAEGIFSLSRLFRLVLNQGKSDVTIEQETELILHYLQIQKMRFPSRLNYKIEVEENVKSAIVPKLIVQPFVENAIVHGFEKVSTCFDVSVIVKAKGEYVQIEIQDTGIGMSQEQIDRIWSDEPDIYRKQRIGGYAIKNIRERLLRKYEDNFSLHIQSEEGKGTKVILIIPWEKGD